MCRVVATPGAAEMRLRPHGAPRRPLATSRKRCCRGLGVASELGLVRERGQQGRRVVIGCRPHLRPGAWVSGPTSVPPMRNAPLVPPVPWEILRDAYAPRFGPLRTVNIEYDMGDPPPPCDPDEEWTAADLPPLGMPPPLADCDYLDPEVLYFHLTFGSPAEADPRVVLATFGATAAPSTRPSWSPPSPSTASRMCSRS